MVPQAEVVLSWYLHCPPPTHTHDIRSIHPMRMRNIHIGYRGKIRRPVYISPASDAAAHLVRYAEVMRRLLLMLLAEWDAAFLECGSHQFQLAASTRRLVRRQTSQNGSRCCHPAYLRQNTNKHLTGIWTELLSLSIHILVIFYPSCSSVNSHLTNTSW